MIILYSVQYIDIRIIVINKQLIGLSYQKL